MATVNNPAKIERQERRLARTPAERQRRFFIHFGVYLAVNIGLATLNLMNNPSNLWFHWVALGWGIGVVAHAMRAFGLSDGMSREDQIISK